MVCNFYTRRCTPAKNRRRTSFLLIVDEFACFLFLVCHIWHHECRKWKAARRPSLSYIFQALFRTQRRYRITAMMDTQHKSSLQHCTVSAEFHRETEIKDVINSIQRSVWSELSQLPDQHWTWATLNGDDKRSVMCHSFTTCVLSSWENNVPDSVWYL